jgi:hypothetical protein
VRNIISSGKRTRGRSTGIRNTAIGVYTLFSNTTGGNNVATGYQALLSNTTGTENTAIGFEALANKYNRRI